MAKLSSLGPRRNPAPALNIPNMMRTVTIGLLALIWPWMASAGFFDDTRSSQDAFLPAEDAFRVEAIALDRERIQARWTIAPGYYLYRHRLDVAVVEPDGLTIRWQPPQGQPYHDEHFGDVEIYHDVLDLPIALTGQGESVTLKLRYQGCADAGLCYPPQTHTVTLDLTTP